MRKIVFRFRLLLILLFGLLGKMNVYADGQKHETASWLPKTDHEYSRDLKLEHLLDGLSGKFRVLSCVYDKASLQKAEIISNAKNDSWSYELISDHINGEEDGIELLLTCKNKNEKVASAGIALAFDIYDWSTDHYVMIPAAVYNGNRNRIVDREYAQGLDRSELYNKDLPLTTCAVPQLSPVSGMFSRIEVNSSNTTTPAICFFDKRKNKAFFIFSEQGIQIGNEILDHGFIIEENSDRSVATLVISAPGVRERKPEFIGFGESPDRGINWNTGDELTIRLKVYAFNCPDIPFFLDRFMTLRKSMTGENEPRHLVPLSEIFNIMTKNIDKRFYESDSANFYCPENANWISFGWIGGLMNTFPMLLLNDEIHHRRVASTFDFAIPRAQGKSGYFYGALNDDGKVFGREGYDEFPEIVLTRKNADLLFWMIKQLMVLKAQELENIINPQWKESLRILADAFVYTWKHHGQWGNFLNNETGDVAVYNTTSGALAVGGLALAAEYYNNPEYLEIAKEAAEYYYQEDFLKKGMTTGGCADILQNADSETAVAFMTSLMTLYEYTKESKWLIRSQSLANLCATWTVSYDYWLPEDTPLAKLGAKLTGAVWASTQNKHGAPGFCTQAGESLFKIYRETGDIRYAKLLYDIIHAYAEGIQPNGQITERLTYCDADSRGSRGDGGKTGWNETNGAMMAAEIPGIYLRTDTNRIFVFDHVEANVLKRENNLVLLEIYNPTKAKANIKILAEDGTKSKQTLGVTAFLDWPVIAVEAGSSIQVEIDTNKNVVMAQNPRW